MIELNEEEIIYIKKRVILQKLHSEIIKGMEDRIILVKDANAGKIKTEDIPIDLHRTQARSIYSLKKVEKMMKYFFCEERIQDKEWVEGSYPRDWNGTEDQLRTYKDSIKTKD